MIRACLRCGVLWGLVVGLLLVFSSDALRAEASGDPPDVSAEPDVIDPDASDSDDLAALDLEDLMGLEITSVSRKAEKLSRTAAAVYVLTNEDIRRSGATSIPEALRMVPGLHVAQATGNRWVVAARGFSEEFNNKLLVLIDGRSVYTPLFSGVYWDVQDTLLEDIERIEVIRGPGATVWGANAVNGVINIITKRAEDTQGLYTEIGAGNHDRAFTGARWGGAVGDDLHYRLYAKYFDRDDFPADGPGNGGDAWTMGRGGFRVDWGVTSADEITLQGDYYRGDVDWRVNEVRDFAPFKTILTKDGTAAEGFNVLGRYTHRFSETSDVQVQSYFDRTQRPLEFMGQERKTADLDVQHRFQLGERQDVVWGAGYRWTRDRLDPSATIGIDPASRVDNLFSAFVQDQILVVKDRLWLTLGSKFEHNDYTGFEYQPSGRLLYTPHEDHTLWAAVSRAVRTPSRVEEDVLFPFQANASNDVFRDNVTVAVPTGIPPGFGPPTVDVNVPVAIPFSTVPLVSGQDGFDSERVMAYELGYRFTPHRRFSVDVAGFVNDYKDLRSLEQVAVDSGVLEAFVPGVVAASLTGAPAPSLNEPGVTALVLLENRLKAHTYGIEVASHFEALPWWNLNLSYSWIRLNARTEGGSNDLTSGAAVEENTPSHQLHLRSNMDLPFGFEVDGAIYYQENFLGGAIGSNVRVDLRLGWQGPSGVRLSLVGQNLLDSERAEFEDLLFGPRSLVERTFYGKVEWAF